MSFPKLLAGVAGICLAFAAVGKAEACVLSIQPSQDNWFVRYDPFAQDATFRQFDVTVENRGDERCSGIVRIELIGEDYGLRTAGDASRVAYTLVDERDGADLTPRAGLNERRPNARPVNLKPGEMERLRFSFTAAPASVPSQGLYSQQARISIVDKDGLTVGERPVSLGLEVIPAAVMGLKGQFQRTDGVARIELGELVSGPRPLTASLYVLSTGGYRVSIRSANDGRLRLGVSEWYVDYVLGVGDRQMDLTSPDSFEIVSRRARADEYPLSVQIGEVAGRRAGDYTDVLTFTVAAL
jgi:hypothetical protein